MKLYITSDVGKNISGYETIAVNNGKFNLEDISNNSCEEIIFIDGLEKIKLADLSQAFNSIFSKMRYGCKRVLSGIDLHTLSQYVLSGNINMGQYANIIEDKVFISDLSEIRHILKSSGITVEKITMKDIYYEISARRKALSN